MVIHDLDDLGVPPHCNPEASLSGLGCCDVHDQHRRYRPGSRGGATKRSGGTMEFGAMKSHVTFMSLMHGGS